MGLAEAEAAGGSSMLLEDPTVALSAFECATGSGLVRPKSGIA